MSGPNHFPTFYDINFGNILLREPISGTARSYNHMFPRSAEDGALVPDGTRDLFMLVLAMAAGGMDALSLLGLGNVFVSALSGNTILLGIAMMKGQLGEAMLCASVFLGFVAGAVLAAHLLRVPPKGSHWNGRVAQIVLMESIILLAFLFVLTWIGDGDAASTLLPLIVLSSFAMGLQYMSMLRMNVKGVTTIFVTSTVVNLVCRLVVKEPSRSDQEGMIRGDERPRGWMDGTNRFLAAIWGAYFSGAVVAAALISQGRVVSALIPVSLLCAITLYTAFSSMGR